MTFRTTLTLSAAILASLSVFPNMAAAQDNREVNAATQLESTSYHPISELSIGTAIESSVMAGEHDEALRHEFDEGVMQAFRAAYAINVMNPLWTERSAKELILTVSEMERQGLVGSEMSRKVEQAFKNRFDGATAEKRAQGDMALSMSYIHLENLRNPPGSQAPRLAELDTNLFSAGQSGIEETEAGYSMNF
jgi:murein L,D-transpeptidase YcbB/YkuD